MDIVREFAAIDRRVQRQIDRHADEALIRLGFDPVAERQAQQLGPIVTGAEALGQAWRSLVDGMAAFGTAFNRGFERGPS